MQRQVLLPSTIRALLPVCIQTPSTEPARRSCFQYDDSKLLAVSVWEQNAFRAWEEVEWEDGAAIETGTSSYPTAETWIEPPYPFLWEQDRNLFVLRVIDPQKLVSLPRRQSSGCCLPLNFRELRLSPPLCLAFPVPSRAIRMLPETREDDAEGAWLAEADAALTALAAEAEKVDRMPGNLLLPSPPPEGVDLISPDPRYASLSRKTFANKTKPPLRDAC